MAWGRPWRLRFLPDCFRFFPELKERVEARVDPRKECVEMDMEELLPGRTRVRCRPAALFFLERAPGSPACQELEVKDAVRLLSRDLICDSPAAMEKHRRAWTRLARSGSYLLRCGEDPDPVVDLLERFIEVSCRHREA